MGNGATGQTTRRTGTPCERPSREDRKKVDQQTRVLYPLTDEVVRQHLEGKKTVGVYPLLTDETCWFLAADFDKNTWQEDALEFVTTCGRLGVPAYLERSRSGNGGHVWMFFDSSDPRCAGSENGLRHSDADHGATASSWSEFLRPFLPQSGHDAARRLWKSDRPATPVVSTAGGQQPLRG